jgi:CHAD domain-containing protein
MSLEVEPNSRPDAVADQDGRSPAYRLKGDEQTAQGVSRIALGRIEKALRQLTLTEDEHLAAAIHEARKEIKKLRAVLRLVREELGEESFGEENRRYRDIGRMLAASRDAQAKLETLNALEEHFGRDFLASASTGWREALQLERQQLTEHATPQSSRPIAEAARELRRGRASIPVWPIEEDPLTLIAAGLRWSYARGRRTMRRVLEEDSSENVHAWRKRAKDLWYQLRIIQDAWPPMIAASAAQAHELADLLGEHHDLAVLGEDLETREGIPYSKTLTALIHQREAEYLERALTLGRRIYAEKPGAFARRHQAYWDAWRTG